MYCKNCGNQINDKAVICPNCGVRTSDVPDKKKKDSSILLGILSFAGYFIPLLGWILGGIGLSQAIRSKNKIGIVLCIIGLALATFMFFRNLGESFNR